MLVAASGGADSTALALALRELGCSIVLAHVHHGIRGAAAGADARFVRRLARKLGVPFVLGRFDVPAEARARGESLEMAARRVRRAFLIETARREGIRRIAVGHTADDQAETVLMRIVRGTSVTGLAGIPHVTRHGGAVFIRPLRDATRRQVLDYLDSRRQAFREDETNAEDFARRNRVRHEILPLLEKRLNPAVRQALLRLADIAAAEDEVMASLARKTKPGAKAPLAIRRRLALDEMRRAGIPPGKQDFHAVENFFPHRGKKRPDFPRCGKKFSIAWKSGENSFHGVENPESAPGLRIRMGRGFSRRPDEVCLSAAAVGGRDLVFRSRRAGDRMAPLGMTGSKKLSDIFTDLKVPREERDAWIVVECGGDIAALAGWRVARGFAVEGPSAPSIRIRWSWRPGRGVR
ncbi:MAG TPA: tRNA lysidine(34) synthetase TilS [Kiritimatiellia bacterium]|nr:tRNA lysidine(34) synthetase TilS [Kiritimatiellia bacterium]